MKRAASGSGKPPAKKKAKRSEAKASEEEEVPADVGKVVVQLKSSEGQETGPQFELPLDATTEQLQTLVNELLSNDEPYPYSFFMNEEEIVTSLKDIIEKQETSTESVLTIVYQPQAVFRVRPVARCTSTLPGHSEAVLHVSFSPDGRWLASGSGDTTVRIWDLDTETPKHTLKGHTNWVLAVAWAPSGKLLASGCYGGEIRIWDPVAGERKGKVLKGHSKYIYQLAWEPFHLNPECSRLASCSKDGTIRIWDVTRGVCLLTMSGHGKPVKCIRWGGTGLLYSGADDRTVKVWDAKEGKLVRTLEGHAHIINHLCLNTDYAMRTGPFDHKGQAPADEKQWQQAALDKYRAVLQSNEHAQRVKSGSSEGKDYGSGELLVSASDDHTLYLWDPTHDKKPLVRMVGHQQPVNYASFSPDGRYIASASFDKSVRLWRGDSGKFVCAFRGHVGAVYQTAWSADSRLLVSSSKDSTMKVWEIRTKKLKFDLPGHADEVYAVDWSPDGERVASGGKDRVLKMWRS